MIGRLPRVEAEQIMGHLTRIESKVDLLGERHQSKSDEHGRRLGGLADESHEITRRLHDSELKAAGQAARIEQLTEEARAARVVAEGKSNRGVGWVSAVIAGVSLFIAAMSLIVR